MANRNRYALAKQPIYETIKNMVNLKIPTQKIAEECFAQYRLEVDMPDTSPETLLQMYNNIAEGMWFAIYNNHDYIGD